MITDSVVVKGRTRIADVSLRGTVDRVIKMVLEAGLFKIALANYIHIDHLYKTAFEEMH